MSPNCFIRLKSKIFTLYPQMVICALNRKTVDILRLPTPHEVCYAVVGYSL